MSDLHHVPSGAGPGALIDEAERKRKRSEICRASRKRILDDKNALESHITELKAETAKKKKTSTNLKKKGKRRTLMLKELKDKTIEIQRRINELKKEEDGQKKQVEALSKHPNLGQNVGFHSLKVEMCRNELTVWMQTDWDDWASEKTELEKEIVEVKMKNPTMQNQERFLLEKMVHYREQGIHEDAK